MLQGKQQTTQWQQWQKNYGPTFLMKNDTKIINKILAKLNAIIHKKDKGLFQEFEVF